MAEAPKPTQPIASTPAPKPVPNPPVVETKPPKATQLPAPTKLERMKQLSEKLGEILAANGGLESNIPTTGSEYWAVKAELNVVRNLPE